LGRLLSKLPGVFGGDTEKARRHLEEAVRIAPEFSTNHLYLAEIFIQKKNYDLAYAEIETLLNHSFPDMDKKTLDEEKKRAEYLLLEIPKRIREKLTTAQAEKRLEHVREKH
jgi:tetratricopeptide (TPR) repeat protein